MSTLAILNEINEDTRDTVFGWIRSNNKKYKNTIPKEIFNLCLLFYGYGSDEWDKSLIPEAVMQLKENSIIKTHDGMANAFFKRVAKYGYHEWIFNVPKHDPDDCDIMIGIWKLSKHRLRKNPPTQYIFFNDNGNGYAYHLDGDKHDGNKTTPYGPKCNGVIYNTKVHMILDLEEKSLKFIINDQDCGKAFDVDPGEYRAAVYIYDSGYSVRFLQ